MVRGIERRLLFADDLDREDLERRLTRILCDAGACCWAWAFMPNHVHLVIETAQIGISRVMARILTGYARRFNQRHERVGYVFQNRFKSRLVQDHGDLLGVIRYVHLNPLSGGLVCSLDELQTFRWCGHSAIAGILPAAGFHDARASLGLFGHEGEARRRWRVWLQEGIDAKADALPIDPEEPRERVEPFAAAVSSSFPAELAPSVELVCKHFGVAPAAMQSGRGTHRTSTARAVLAHIAVDRIGLGVRAIAPLLGVSPSALSRAAARGRSIARDRGLV
jgi:REP element-mobilizing transposase RayT